MKYRYLYQTKDNENRSGEISAPDRAQAYAMLRKQGIRPYRLIGDDPKWWQRWRIYAAASVAVAIAVASVLLALSIHHAREAVRPSPRVQLAGDGKAIEKWVSEGWADVLPLPLDRYLAVYAQPGWRLEPPQVAPEDLAAFAAQLDAPLERSQDDPDEVRQLKNILLRMRQDMRDYLAAGGSMEDYLEYLKERQDQECELREKAKETLERAPEFMRQRAWRNLNARLRDMGIAPLPPE